MVSSGLPEVRRVSATDRRSHLHPRPPEFAFDPCWHRSGFSMNSQTFRLTRVSDSRVFRSVESGQTLVRWRARCGSGTPPGFLKRCGRFCGAPRYCSAIWSPVILPPEFPRDQLDPLAMACTVDGTPALEDAGFDVLNLANNHILDGGILGMFHTRDVVEARGIMAIGVGATQDEARRLRVLERSGLRWGFLCYAEDSVYTLSTSGPCHAYYEPTLVLRTSPGPARRWTCLSSRSTRISSS